jgi:ribonuclease R
MRDVLAEIEGHPAARALSFQVLRSLKQAQYSSANVGHFGLASERYVHFTSPIRRYPDLVAHRLLKASLHREGQASGGGGVEIDRAELDRIAAACSSFERRAVEAEREAVAMYRALIMKDNIGDSFDGRVSGVAHFGAFVETDDPFVEGMIKTEALGDDTFDFDARTMTLTGRRSGFTLGLGDAVRVEVTNASVLRRRIDFALVGAAGSLRPPAKPRRVRGATRSKASASSRKDGRSQPRGGGKVTSARRTRRKRT